MRKFTLTSALSLAIFSLSNPAFALNVSFKWCSGSPQFQVGNVPKGTVKLDLQMTDLDFTSFRHGGGSVAYKGQKTIECGALDATYSGPNPPRGSHTYEWVIRALDASGNELAKTSVRRDFPE